MAPQTDPRMHVPVDAIVVLNFRVTPEQIADVLEAIDPPRLPHFAGQARIAVGTDATAVIDWLEGRADNLATSNHPTPRRCAWSHTTACGQPPEGQPCPACTSS